MSGTSSSLAARSAGMGTRGDAYCRLGNGLRVSIVIYMAVDSIISISRRIAEGSYCGGEAARSGSE